MGKRILLTVQGISDKTGVRSLFGDLLNVASSHIVLILLGLISSVLSTRILGKEGYGFISLFGMVTGVMFLLTSNWTIAAVLRFGREEYDKKGKLNHTFWARNIILIPCLASGFVVAYLLRGKITNYVDMPKWALWLMMGSVLVVEAQTYVDYILQATHRMKVYAVTRIFRSVVSIVGLTVIFLGLLNQTYLTVIVMGICTGAASTFFLILFLFPSRTLLPLKTDRGMLKEVFLFSYPIIIGNTAAYVVNWIDVVFIKYYYAIADVGGYQLSYNIFSLVDGIVGTVNVLMAPVLISFIAAKREDLIIHYGTRLVSQGVLLWSVVVGVGISIAPIFFQIIYGKDFFISATYFQFLAVGLFFSSLLYFYSGVISAYKLMKFDMVVNITRAMVNLIGNLLLVPGIGPLGAALANTAGIGVAALFYLLICQRQLKKGLFWELLLALPVLLSLGVNRLVSSQGSPFLAIAVTLMVGYCLAKTFHIFRQEDLRFLDYIQMPPSLKKMIVWAYPFLAGEENNGKSELPS
jgi:O-antigen/teichoic acid export membrane protein